MELGKNIGIPPHDIAKAAVEHDMMEVLTGDIPTPCKHDGLIKVLHGDSLPHVHSTIKSVIKLADTIEAIVYITMWGYTAFADGIRREMLNRLNVELQDEHVLAVMVHKVLREALSDK